MADKKVKKSKKTYKVGVHFFESVPGPVNGITEDDWTKLQAGEATELTGILPGFLNDLLNNKQLEEI